MRRELKKGLLSVTYRYHVDDSPDSFHYEVWQDTDTEAGWVSTPILPHLLHPVVLLTKTTLKHFSRTTGA